MYIFKISKYTHLININTDISYKNKYLMRSGLIKWSKIVPGFSR